MSTYARLKAKIKTPRPLPVEAGSCMALMCANGHKYICQCARYDYCYTSHDWPTCHCGHTRHNHIGALTEDDADTLQLDAPDPEGGNISDAWLEIQQRSAELEMRQAYALDDQLQWAHELETAT
jgi:hypothetical protein